MTTRIQIRRDVSTSWTAANPTLAAGEIGYETDTGGLKIGDGSTAWNSLSYGPAVASAQTDHVFVNPYGVYSDMDILTSGTSWTVPTLMRKVGVKWKVTLVGGGAQGGGTSTTSGQTGGGGGSGAVVIGFYTYVSGVDTMTYSIGAAGSGAGTNTTGTSGTATTTTYNSVTYSAGGGSGGNASAGGGSGGTATGGTLNLSGNAGSNGGVMAATSNYQGTGGDTPMGLGFGGEMPATAAGATGTSGSNYGAGGSGGRTGTGTSSRAGGAGTAGVLIVEY